LLFCKVTTKKVARKLGAKVATKKAKVTAKKSSEN